MDFTGYKTLRFDYQDRVLWVTIDGNGKANPVDHALHHDLSRVFIDLQDDPDSDLIVLTGAGDFFCAGGDMTWFQEMIDDPRKFRAIGPAAKRIVFSLIDLEKPILCRLNGAAAGLGASIALLCDIIIASDTAKIGDPHVKMGLVAGDGGAVIWPQLIGYARAKEFLLTGDMLTAVEAERLGLINYAVPLDELDEKVGEMVSRITANPRWAVRWTKTAVNLPLKDIATRVMDAAISYEMSTNQMADHQETVAAFNERRAPKLTGE
jgi:enoyl-CoA hydratase/carnithine racemase